MAANDEAKGLFPERKFICQFLESGLHSIANDENDFVNAPGLGKPAPGMSDDWFPGDFEEQLVHIRPHAGAFAGGDDHDRVSCFVFRVQALESYSRNSQDAIREE